MKKEGSRVRIGRAGPGPVGWSEVPRTRGRASSQAY